ncbi:MAG: EAL domain-containing protein, partial [Wenzhouxiangella sp.]
MPETTETIRILVVEDSEADFLLVKRRLSRDGLDFTCERVDEHEALTRALQTPPDVILYDFEIPGMEFTETLALIKARAPEVPIILVSGTVGENMAARLLHEGLDDFVLKDNLVRLPSAVERARRERAERAGRLAAEAQLRKLAMVVEQSPASIIISDTRPAIEYVNDAFVRCTGYSRDDVLGQNPSLLNTGNTPASTYRELWATLEQGKTWRGEFINTRKDGSIFIEAAVVAPVRQPDGQISHYLAIKDDITAQRQSEELIERLAFYDPLTELANRSLLLEQLQQAMTTCSETGLHGAIIVLDLDSFRFINDVHGYETGDRLLREVGRRLCEAVSEVDTVARIGGDQFAMVIRGLSPDAPQSIERAQHLACQIHQRLYEPHTLHNGSAQIRHASSMGAYVFDGTEGSAENALNRAELALQKAKDDGGNLVRLFSPELKALVEERANTESRLRGAVVNGDLEVHLQSQFDIDGGLIGAEMLLRWPQPDGSYISPMIFIPLAETTGLILPIGEQVLDQAMTILQTWQAEPDTRALKLSVNVSARQFHQPDFVEALRSHLQKHPINPSRLMLELTESVVLDDLEITREKMLAIRELGVGIALDDFGKGYSSLSYLKHLPFDLLKIDHSFVADMLTSESSEAIVRAILAMASALKLSVIAEGVETVAQWDLLRREHCSGCQGYLFARPARMDLWRPGDFEGASTPNPA